MNRIKLLMLALCGILLTVIPAWAEWYSLAPDGSYSGLELLSQDATKVVFSLDVGAFEFNELSTGGGHVEIFLPDGDVTSNIGRPLLPVIRRMVQIPEGATVKVDANYTRKKINLADFTSMSDIMPVQPPIEKFPGARENAPFVKDENFYSKNAFYLPEPAVVVDTGYLRHIRFATIEIRPMDYNPFTGDLVVRRNLNVNISFINGNYASTLAMAERYSDKRINALATNIMPNHRTFAPKADLVAPSSYLIIGPESLINSESLTNFAQWKKYKGYDVIIQNITDVGSTPDQIRDFIINAFQSWQRPPSFVLFVGDTDTIPNIVGMTVDSPATDLYYACMDDTDYVPDIGIGRFSVRTVQQLNNVVAKTLVNEIATWTGGNDWIKKAAFMAGWDNFQVSTGTHNYVISTYLTPNDYVADKIYSILGGTTQKIIQAINQGRSLAVYSGHGSETGWVDGPPLDQSQLANLTNNLYPFVCSHACLTGAYETPECFGETWIRIQSGALAFWGSSVTSYWDEDDILERSMFKAFFTGDQAGGKSYSEMPWLSGMTDYAKILLKQHYNSGGNTQRYFEMYNLFGDPDTMVFTDSPSTLAVTVNSNVTFPCSQIVATITDGAGVMVGITRDDAYFGSAFADASGNATVNLLEPLTSETKVAVTVTKHNAYVWHQEITITGTPADDDTIDDDTTSDDDNFDDDVSDDDASDDATDDDAAEDDDNLDDDTNAPDDDSGANDGNGSEGSNTSGCGC